MRAIVSEAKWFDEAVLGGMRSKKEREKFIWFQAECEKWMSGAQLSDIFPSIHSLARNATYLDACWLFMA